MTCVFVNFVGVFLLKNYTWLNWKKVSYTSDLMMLFLFCELEEMLGDALDLKGETTSEKKRKGENKNNVTLFF